MEADATDWQLCSAGVCCHARGTDAKYCGNAMPDLAPTGSQLDHLLVTQRRRRRHRRPRKRQRVRAKEWRERMVKARRVRRSLAIHTKQQQQRAQKVPGPSKGVSMKNFQAVQAEAASKVAVATTALTQTQDELRALKCCFESLQRSKDELQKSARTAVLGLQNQASEAQRSHRVTTMALDAVKDELRIFQDTLHDHDEQAAEHKATALLAADNLKQMHGAYATTRSHYEESEAEVDRLLDENFKLRADIQAADEDYEEQECYISQVELKANSLQGILNHLTATHKLLQEEI